MVDPLMSTKKHNKKSKRKKPQSFSVEVTADSDGSAAAPILAYFPSGYNPEEPSAEASAYRHVSHSSRIELVVNPTAFSESAPTKSNVQFVGSSYQGEAAAGPQLCSYALGVLDKEKQTLRLVPVTANKILRMVPRVVDRQPDGAEPVEAAKEEVRKIADLTSLYGTKRDKVRDSKFRMLNEQMRDLPAREHLQSSMNDAEFEEAHNDVSEAAPRNIPPHNVSADRPDNAYPLDEIILKHERGQLLDVLELVNSGECFVLKTKFWQENGYPSFVYNRVHRLLQIKSEEEKASLACIMSYITHLIKFMELHKRARNFHGSSANQHNIPRVVYQKLMTLFVDPISQAISSEKKELLIEYILVLTLHVDRFNTDPSDIAIDLKMPDKSLALYYYQLGCKLKQGVMSLPLPLDFPELRRRGRKKR